MTEASANGHTEPRSIAELVRIALERSTRLADDDAPEEILIAASFLQELDNEQLIEVAETRAVAVRDQIHAEETFDLEAESLIGRLVESGGTIFVTRARGIGIFEDDSVGANDMCTFTAYEDEDEDGAALIVVEMAYIPGPESGDDAFIGEINASSITITLRPDDTEGRDATGLRGDAFFGTGEEVEDEGSVLTVLATLSLLLSQSEDGEQGFLPLPL